MKSHDLTIGGMSCNHCITHVKIELSKVTGLEIEDVQIGKARVRFEESSVSTDRLAQAIEDAGYRLLSSS